MAKHTSPSEAPPYVPPQPTGGRCPHCGSLVLVRIWKDGAYVELARPLTCVKGDEHHCRGEERLIS